MKGFVAYKIIPELRLIIEVGKGIVTLDNIIGVKAQQPLDVQYNSTYNFISDIREAELQLTEQSILEYVKFAKQNEALCGSRFSAFLTDSPNQVTMATLYELEGVGLPMNYKVVSSLSVALEWVELYDEHYDRVDKEIEMLKKHPKREANFFLTSS